MLAFSTTWLFVRIYPSSEIIIPLPGISLNGKKKKLSCGLSVSDTTVICTIVGVTLLAVSINALLNDVASASRLTGGLFAPRFISANPGLTNPNPETRRAPKRIPANTRVNAPNNLFDFMFYSSRLKFN